MPQWDSFAFSPATSRLSVGYDRQRTVMCPDGESARELTRNSQPSYGAGLEVGALGTLAPGGFFAAGTSRSPFRAIPVEGPPADPVVAIDISSPKMMMENRAAQHAPKIRIIMALLSTHVNKLITPVGSSC